jgi:hypothetical protein
MEAITYCMTAVLGSNAEAAWNIPGLIAKENQVRKAIVFPKTFHMPDM